MKINLKNKHPIHKQLEKNTSNNNSIKSTLIKIEKKSNLKKKNINLRLIILDKFLLKKNNFMNKYWKIIKMINV